MSIPFGREPAGRVVAMRAGWNDAAWGRSYNNTIDSTLARWYEQGFQGGAAFRRGGRTQPSIEPAGQNPRQLTVSAEQHRTGAID